MSDNLPRDPKDVNCLTAEDVDAMRAHMREMFVAMAVGDIEQAAEDLIVEAAFLKKRMDQIDVPAQSTTEFDEWASLDCRVMEHLGVAKMLLAFAAMHYPQTTGTESQVITVVADLDRRLGGGE